MEAFTAHTGKIAVYGADNVDTDRIIPARFLTMVTRSGYGEQLFKDVRGSEFPLDRPEASGASVLVAGTNFGCGSSREHAVWAIQQAGFRAVIARRSAVSEGFSDIFRQNAANCGLLLIELAAVDHERIAAAGSGAQVTIDLPAQTVQLGSDKFHFEIRPALKDALVKGLDLIGTTLEYEQAISAYEMRNRLRNSSGGAKRSSHAKGGQNLWLGLLLVLICAGCSAKQDDGATSQSEPTLQKVDDKASKLAVSKLPTGENPDRLFQLSTLRKVDIQVGGHTVHAWLMDTAKKREEGFMFVKDSEVKPDEGMIFAFPSPVSDPDHGFWMKDTLMALDIAFFGADKKLLNVGDGQPLSQDNVRSAGPYLYVLETKAGTFNRFGLRRGARLTAPKSVKAVD